MSEIATDAARVLAMAPEMTIYQAAEIRQALLDALAAGGPVAVDLSAVAELDCSGVQLMLAAQRQAGADGVALSWHGHSPAVLEALALLELGARFGVAGGPDGGGRDDA
ncbi:STAS domain-containing protein [Janthinobacterium fluminis]|uniref:STAS domain-containing protein n=1 Tax=Janthinobacterium fluminis TaxID=2987524 RepID=A0ABT5JUZ7_9BURK|nr:STAS domain-containing protein [Janthinobacterium fluminis]MDC8756454.1 STAS domain-containing protein [Janthinobacterium fluminis]